MEVLGGLLMHTWRFGESPKGIYVFQMHSQNQLNQTHHRLYVFLLGKCGLGGWNIFACKLCIKIMNRDGGQTIISVKPNIMVCVTDKRHSGEYTKSSSSLFNIHPRHYLHLFHEE